MKILRWVPVFVSLLLFVCASQAQDRVRVINASLAANSARSAVSDQTPPKRITDPTYIPKGSRVYIADINGLPGFENNLVAALQKKQVKMVVVADRSLAS